MIVKTIPKLEKIKFKSDNYLNNLNHSGEINSSTYFRTFDFYENLLIEAYNQGTIDAKPIECKNCEHYNMMSNKCNGFCLLNGDPYYPWDYCSKVEERKIDEL